MPVVDISMRLLLGTGTYSLTSAIAIVHPGFEVEALTGWKTMFFLLYKMMKI